MADREYIITFDPETGKARVRLPGKGDWTLLAGSAAKNRDGDYNVKAPSAQRADS